MSLFTKYNSELNIAYHAQASKLLDKDYWVVTKPFSYYLGDDYRKIANVPMGFLTDGASVPRVFWWLIPPWGRYGQAAVLHDYLCETGVVSDGLNDFYLERDRVDNIFNEAMGVLGVYTITRHIMYIAVCLFRILKNAKTPMKRTFKQQIEAQIVISKQSRGEFSLSKQQIERLLEHRLAKLN